MSSIFDVIVYIFDWLRTTEYAPISIGDNVFTFTLLEILLAPVIAGLTILVIKGIKSLFD